MYKILIVEDETLLRKGLIYSMDFSELNSIVIGEASNGLEGIEQIKALKPDIVITDINMPFKSGLEMLEETKEFDYSAIILSGYNEFEYAKKAIEFDVSQYILKPVNHKELKEAIKKAIKNIEMKKSFNKISDNIKEISDKTLITTKSNLSYYVKSVISIIESEYMNKLVMQDIVDKLDVSATLLNSRFKNEVGITINDYLNRYRIQVAIKLLKENSMPIYKIALETGFSDYKYFNKVFNKYMGCSPSEYINIVDF
ncbi:MAG: response regulator [Erysipelotrichaceae bacterium]|nr:response regulator [Erysipelotrichaceae bacterium]